MRNFTRADGYAERDLLHFAFGHLASAKLLFDHSPTCYDSAAALSHLAIELLLKALLLLHNDQFPRTHDLPRLFGKLVKAVPEIEITQEEKSVLSQINNFAFLRYPDPSGSPDIGSEDLQPILNLAASLRKALPSELQQEFHTKLEKGNRILMRKPIDPKTTEHL